jgi:precorrin-6B methylase 2
MRWFLANVFWERFNMTELHAGGAAHWDISPEVLAFLNAHLRPGMVTLETGAGASTLAFAESGARHVAVTPSEEEARAINTEAARRAVSMDAVSFVFGFSQEVLPTLSGELDLVLIDGGHGFPIPAVDFAYTAPRLKPGGHLLIDDVDLWTGRMLVDFLDGEAAWKRVAILRGRTAVYELTAPFALREWTNQKAVVDKSRLPQSWRKARNAIGLALKGDFKALADKAANERRLADAARRDY